MIETFWLPIILAVLAATPSTILAWAILRKTKLLTTKTDDIHILVNSNLAAVKTQLAAALELIEDLQKKNDTKANRTS